MLNSFTALNVYHFGKAKPDAAFSGVGNKLLSAKLLSERYEIHRTVNDTAKFIECGNRSAERKVLIIGDSFAGHLLQMAHFLGISGGIHFHIWIKYACSPIFNTSRVQIDAKTFVARDVHKYDACEKWMAYLENALLSFAFEAIFVAGRWKLYTTRKPSKLVQSHPMVRLLLPTSKGDGRQKSIQTYGTEIPSSQQERLLFESKILETVTKLKQFSENIVFVSEVPETGVDFLTCKKYVLRRRTRTHSKVNHTILDEEVLEHCRGPSRQEVMKSVQYMDSFVEHMQSQRHLVAVYPSEFFCDPRYALGEYCRTVIDNFLLYKDGVHLSEFGALLMGVNLLSMEFIKKLV
ncbi:hypothetical protein FGB62_200g010 [Gracilaria domingensis]|nr:hypothetical protein FGB62_200g010 [Gracilaria domingensis]